MKQHKQIGVRGLRVKTGVKAGYIWPNHNETLVRDLPRVRSLRVKSGVKAGGLNNMGGGGIASNHSETLVRDLPRVRGMRVKTGVKAWILR